MMMIVIDCHSIVAMEQQYVAMVQQCVAMEQQYVATEQQCVAME